MDIKIQKNKNFCGKLGIIVKVLDREQVLDNEYFKVIREQKIINYRSNLCFI